METLEILVQKYDYNYFVFYCIIISEFCFVWLYTVTTINTFPFYFKGLVGTKGEKAMKGLLDEQIYTYLILCICPIFELYRKYIKLYIFSMPFVLHIK